MKRETDHEHNRHHPDRLYLNQYRAWRFELVHGRPLKPRPQSRAGEQLGGGGALLGEEGRAVILVDLSMTIANDPVLRLRSLKGTGNAAPMNVNIAGLKWELKRHPFFASLSDDELDGLLSSAQSIVFPARRQIFSQGDDSDCLYILLSGRVKISVFSDTGKETVLAFMGENDVLGEMGVFDGDVRSAAATTLEETRALQLFRSDMIAFLERAPRVALQIIATLCERLRHTNILLEDIATLPAGPRLARVLLRLGGLYGEPGADGAVRIDLRVSQGNLGAHAGLMRENVNRQLRQWENEGVLSHEAGVITILQSKKLRAIGDT